jgi:hypothetical protein
MTAKKLRSIGEIVRRAFELLLGEASPVHEQLVLKHLSQITVQGGSGNLHRASGLPFGLSVDTFQLATIATAKAGWLRKENGLWSVTEQGRQQYEQYSDPAEFLIKASHKSARGWTALHLPRLYRCLGRLKYQIQVEARMIRRLGLGRLTRELIGLSMPRLSALPLQSPLQIVIPNLQLRTLKELRGYLDSVGIKPKEGAHTIYIGPDDIEASEFRILRGHYPPNAGLKLMKTPGSLRECGYLHGENRGLSLLHKKLIYKHPKLCLVANFLHAQGLGPQLYDLVELRFGDQVWTAYVVEHVRGIHLTAESCAAGFQRMRELERQRWIKSNLPDGWEDEEFKPSASNDNVLLTEHGEFRYIDFQNFLLTNHQRYLEGIATKASIASHWGDCSVLRGGRYLYHTVPGLRLPGRRDTMHRGTRLAELLSAAGVSIQDRLVLDIGCNVGMMMGQYLRMAAAWCHGWDMPEVIPHTRELLLATGCTRFSLSSVQVDQNRDLINDLPDFLKRRVCGCVISYLAVRHPLGWINDLARIQWSVLIYEGHEDDSPKDFERYMTELSQKVCFRVGSVATFRDGDCGPRTVAVLLRR